METLTPPRTTTLEQTPVDEPVTQVAYGNMPPDQPPRTDVATGEYSDGDSDAPRDVVPMDALQRAEADAHFSEITAGFGETARPPEKALALGEGVLKADDWMRTHGDGDPSQPS